MANKFNADMADILAGPDNKLIGIKDHRISISSLQRAMRLRGWYVGSRNRLASDAEKAGFTVQRVYKGRGVLVRTYVTSVTTQTS